VANSISSFTLKKNISSVVCALAFTSTLFVGVGAGAGKADKKPAAPAEAAKPAAPVEAAKPAAAAAEDPICGAPNIGTANPGFQSYCEKNSNNTTYREYLGYQKAQGEKGGDQAAKCESAVKEWRTGKKDDKTAKADEAKTAKEDTKNFKKDIKDLQKDLATAQSDIRTKLQEAKAEYDKNRMEMSNVTHPKQTEDARAAKMGIEGNLRKLRAQLASVQGKVTMSKVAANIAQSRLASAGSQCAIAAEANKIDLEKKFKGVDKGALLEQDRQYRAQCMQEAKDKANAEVVSANITLQQSQSELTQINEEIVAQQTALTEADARLQGLAAKQAQELAALTLAYNEKVTTLQQNASQEIMRLQQNIQQAQADRSREQMGPYLQTMMGSAFAKGADSGSDPELLDTAKKVCDCNKVDDNGDSAYASKSVCNASVSTGGSMTEQLAGNLMQQYLSGAR
jgi:hypothetical protein